jgi:hypothetical protein
VKKNNATKVLASGFRKAHPAQVSADVASTPSANTERNSERHVSFGDEVVEKVEEEGEIGDRKRPSRHSGESREERRQRHKLKKQQREREAMEELRESPQMARLRQMVRKDSTALQHFLEALTKANPDLMKLIAHRREEFMAMVLAEGTETLLSQPAPPPPTSESAQESEADGPCSPQDEVQKAGPQDKVRKAMRQRQRIERAFQPQTTAAHPLTRLHSPYSCAVCKSTRNLMICSACKSVRFCGREHQRQYWPRHQSVCKFLAACQGGLLRDVSGKHWSTEALPQILNVWLQDSGRNPEPHEYEQLVHMPRCHRCRKVPAPVACERSFAVGYCSEVCRAADTEWRESWQCNQSLLTGAVASVMYKAGGGMPFCMGNPECTLPSSVFENGWEEYITTVDVQDARGNGFMGMSPIPQQVIVDQLSYPMALLEGLFRAGRRLENLCWGKEDLEVHLFNPEQGAMADMEKFEALMYHAGPQVKTLHLRLIGNQVPAKESGVHEKLDFTKRLQKRCQERGYQMFIHFYQMPCEEWLDKEYRDIARPVFRAAFSPIFDQWPDDDQMDLWGPVLKRLASLEDGIPLVVTEKLMSVIKKDVERAETYGLRTLVKPDVPSAFCSPLALVDDLSSKEDNPCGLAIWNMAVAVFEAVPTNTTRDSSSALEQQLQDMVVAMTSPFRNYGDGDSRDVDTEGLEEICRPGSAEEVQTHQIIMVRRLILSTSQ